jgi:hypothetical protein
MCGSIASRSRPAVAMLEVLVQARGKLTRDRGSLILRNPSSLAHPLLTVADVEFVLSEDAPEHPPED